ncbi:MAG: pectinesterase family protein [Lachnoclostridium sp.]|nr:pectinesterase family protein [Lachnoclostridium sp.]
MKNFKTFIMIFAALCLGLTLQAQTVDRSGVTLKWELEKGVDNPSDAEVSDTDLFTYTAYSVGTGLTAKEVRTTGGYTQTLYQPSVNNEGTPSDDGALHFTMKAKKGLTFAPKSLSFNATKYGTDGGSIDVDVVVNGQVTKLVTNQSPNRNNKDVPYTEFNLDLSTLPATSDEVEVKIYIYKLGNSKQVGVGDVVVTGDVKGTVETVAMYSLSLDSNMEDAGELKCLPAGETFEEGTLITVSATENFGYHFQSWNDANGVVVSTENPYSFEIKANTSLTAVYTRNNVYALNLTLEGGANVNLVQYTPEGNVIDGVHYYEEGTEVRLTTLNNRILTFTSWEDNSTAPEREVVMDGVKNISATFAACDYIVGWDFYYDSPNSQRAADYKDESDNAGLLSLRNADGNTSTWLTRGINNGAENGKWGARIWRNRADGYYFEVSFSTVGYSNIVVSAALGVNYNTYSVNNMQYSVDGENFTTAGTYNLQSGWTSNEFALPAEAANQSRVWVRFMPDRSSALVGNATDNDGLAIAELFILADKDAADDNTAPQLVNIIPADGSDGVSATGSIILTFDEKVKLGSGDATLNGNVIAPRVSGKSVVYNYSGLEYATEYTFTVPAGAITDRSGNQFAGVTSKFTTMERVQPSPRLYDVIVAADGSGDFTSLQDAIDAAPDGRIKPYLIFVKNGEYVGHVDIPASKPMMHIIGQDRDKTIITHDRLCGGDNAYHVSVGATVVVNSADCFFENITLENSYGHRKAVGPQALALNTIGDRSIFNNVAMLSYQDTWITTSTSNYRTYVRNSFIEGAVDFIYNSGNIYVDNTILYIIRESGGYIVAPSHGADVEWGYVFNNCTITAPGVPSKTTVWLGRPWHNYPKTVFLNTRAEVTIPATGWYETMGGLPAIWADWNTTDGDGNLLDLSQRRDTYYYTDSDGKKVYGTAKNHLTDEEAAEYTVKNVLSGSDNWEPVIKTEECETPVVSYSAGLLTWEPVKYAICYLVTKGDEVVGFTTDCQMNVNYDNANDLYVQAVNEFGGLSTKGSVNNSGLVAPEISSDYSIIDIYDLRGVKLQAPCQGVNIIRMVNASGDIKVEKVVIK